MLTSLIAIACLCTPQEPAEKPLPLKHPLSKSEQLKIQEAQTTIIKQTSQRLAHDPTDLRAVSARADAFFFLGQFKQALKDYDRIVELDPSADASHWRRGIAHFYVGDFKKATKQFERYHSFDNVDRENGIWRYLCQRKSKGLKAARQGLLKYEKDDREPFPAVYKLFAGKMTPDQILKQISAAKLTPPEREQRLFYAELYIGLNELVEGRKQSAAKHLGRAVATKWPRNSGFGPNYMWHVGRLQLDLLRRPARKKTPVKPKTGK